MGEHAARRPLVGRTVPGLRHQQGCETREASRPADSRDGQEVRSRSCRHRVPLRSLPGVQVHPHRDRQDDPLARGNAYFEHDSGRSPAGIHGRMDLMLRSPQDGDFRSRCPIHVGGVEDGPEQARDKRFYHHCLPSAGKRDGGTFSSRPEERTSVCLPVEQIMDAIAVMGVARLAECAQGRDSDLHHGSRVRHTPAGPRNVLPRRTITEVISPGPARASAVERRGFFTRHARPPALQGLPFRGKVPKDSEFRLHEGRQVGKAKSDPQVHGPIPREGEGLGEQHLYPGLVETRGRRVTDTIEGGQHATRSNVTMLLGEVCCIAEPCMARATQDEAEETD